MNSRILKVRKYFNLTQDSFGKHISLTRSAIANIENGNRGITDRVILDICREFNVNETWLCTGIGEMFKDTNTDQELCTLIGSENQFVKDTILALVKLDEKDLHIVRQIIDRLNTEGMI